MSILLKGFTMPKACTGGGCPVIGGYCNLWWDVDDGERHGECPLIELPDHGDLIDRDELWDEMVQTDNFQEAQNALWGSPVVIPAERSEE